MKKILILCLSLSLTIMNCGKKEEPKTDEPEAKTASLDAETTKGKEVFDLNCSSCHGALGAGDGVAAASLNPKPRNFKAPASEWKNGNTEAGITKTLNEGIKGSPMVSYKQLGDESIKAVTKYVLYLNKN
jgi:mono/diheme cytochrome c family protein